MSAGDIALLVSIGTLVLGAVPVLYRSRKQSRTRALVWDEILGHDAAPGVPYKPSLTDRITHLDDHTDARFQTVNRRLADLEGHAVLAAQASRDAAVTAHEIKEAVTGSNGD
jgi:hypothetical protein